MFTWVDRVTFATVISLRLFPAVLFSLTGSAWSHPADVSHLQVKVEPHHVELRLTMNLLTLSSITVIDANRDLRITASEVANAAPRVADFLRKKVHITINGEASTLGDLDKYEAVWPDARTNPVSDREASQRFVDFYFQSRCPRIVRNIWLGFDCYDQWGDLHTIKAIYQQSEHQELPVEFSAREPDFLYETGWTEPAANEVSGERRNVQPWSLGMGIAAVIAAVLAWVRNARRSP